MYKLINLNLDRISPLMMCNDELCNSSFLSSTPVAIYRSLMLYKISRKYILKERGHMHGLLFVYRQFC